MSEMNKELLKANIRKLLEERGVTQAELAEITGMSQPNVSKALNPKDKKCFTVDQLFAIAQHYGVSIDELVGNKAPNEFATSPRAALAFITKLLCESKLRHTTVEVEEWVYEYEYTSSGRVHSFKDNVNGRTTVYSHDNSGRITGVIASDNEDMLQNI